jgi:hypothetical protein
MQYHLFNNNFAMTIEGNELELLNLIKQIKTCLLELTILR